MKRMLVLSALFAIFISASGQAQFINPVDSVPVRIQTISIERQSGTTLHWTVVCQLQHAQFEIQKSYNGINFNTIHAFAADKARCREPFFFEDNENQRSFYRVRVGDLDGRFYSSKIVSSPGVHSNFEVNGLYPTLVRSSAELSVSATASTPVSSRIIDGQGRIQGLQSFMMPKGSSTVTINTSLLQPGIYYMVIFTPVGPSRTFRFLKL